MISDAAVKNTGAGRGIGVCVLAGFGALWLYNALSLSRAPLWWFALMWAGSASLVAGGILLIRASRAAGSETRQDRQVAKRFWLVFAAEGAGIVGAILLLQILHLDRYVVPAIAAIVGLHFLPLASLFKAPLYYLAGIAIVFWSAATIVFVSHEIARDIAVTYGAGFILWTTALLLVLRRR